MKRTGNVEVAPWDLARLNCPECKGRGELDFSRYDRKSRLVYFSERCYACGGTGRSACRACGGDAVLVGRNQEHFCSPDCAHERWTVPE
jgi:DnaJ-class molecular chaperone